MGKKIIVTLLLYSTVFIWGCVSDRGTIGNDGQATKDIAKYTREIEQNPSNADAYYNRGNIYYDMGDYELAIEDYKSEGYILICSLL